MSTILRWTPMNMPSMPNMRRMRRNPFISRVSITVAVLAVMAAAAGSLETVEGGRAITESSEAVLAQDKATDSWNEYQADSLKRHMYEIASVAGSAKAEEYAKEIDKDRSGQDKARDKAEECRKGPRRRICGHSAVHEQRHHWLTGAATLIEIGIALSTVAIITARRTFWFSAMGLGAAGRCCSRWPISAALGRRRQIALLHQHAGGVEEALMLGDLAVLHRPAEGNVEPHIAAAGLVQRLGLEQAPDFVAGAR